MIPVTHMATLKLLLDMVLHHTTHTVDLKNVYGCGGKTHPRNHDGYGSTHLFPLALPDLSLSLEYSILKVLCKTDVVFYKPV